MVIQIKNSTGTRMYSRKHQYCLEWRKIKTIISQVVDETLGNYKEFTQNKQLKIWEDEIKLIAQDIENSGNNSIAIESNICKIKSNTFELLTHRNNGMKE